MQKETVKSNLKADYTTPYRSKEMLSIVFLADIENQQQKRQVQQTINIDFQTQKMIKLGDLFRKKDYKQKLAKELRISLKELPEQTEEQFYFDKDRGLIVFWENEYGVTQEYAIPFVEMKKMLKDNYQYLLVQNQP